MPLQGKTFYAGGIAITDFVPLETDVITVVMQDRKAYTYTPTYQGGMLHWIDNGELEVGTYSVEVLVERESGAQLRCLRVNQVNIVETNDESELDEPIESASAEDSSESERVGSDAQETEANTVGSTAEETPSRSLPASIETPLDDSAPSGLPEPVREFVPKDILSAGVFIFGSYENYGIREIAEGVFAERIVDVENSLIHEFEAKISISARELRSEYTHDIQDAVSGVTESYQSLISQTAEQITLAVSHDINDAITGVTEAYRSEITQTADRIALSVTAEIDNAITGVTERYTSLIEQTARSIAMTVSEYKRDADGKYRELYSEFIITAGMISSKVSRTEYDEWNRIMDERYTLIQQTADSIISVVQSASLMSGRLSVAESNIIQLSDSIELRATRSELIAATGELQHSLGQLIVRSDLIEASVSSISTHISEHDSTLLAYYDWLVSIQRQVDDEIDAWFYSGTPTLSNMPASEWTTDDLKEAHIGDLYYDKGSADPYDPDYSETAGAAFRFDRSGTPGNYTYSWVQLADEAIAKALQLAMRAQTTADGKMRVFLSQPVPPYQPGDQWIKTRSVVIDGTTMNYNEIWHCITEKVEGQFFSESDWEKSEEYEAAITKANLKILSNAIVGQVASYDSDGLITNASAITQTASQIRLQVANGAIDTAVGANGKITTPLLNTGIDIINGQIEIVANRFYLKNQYGRVALALTTDSNNNPLIAASNLEINGIFSTTPGSVWLTEKNGILTTASGYADDAVSTAATNAATYITNNVIPLIDAVDDRVDDVSTSLSGLNYLKLALLNGTTAIGGGLVLTSLVGLGGNTGTEGAWELWSGIRGLESGESRTGIAAWFGGEPIDCFTISCWANMTHTQRESYWTNTERYARSLFRQDGSGYLASGEISWGASGEIVLHGISIESADIDSDTTFSYQGQTFTVADLVQLRSWFTVDHYTDSNNTTHYYLKLNTSSSPGGIEGFATDGFITAGGLSTSGGGGGGGGLTPEGMWQLLGQDDATKKISSTHLRLGTGLAVDESGNIYVNAAGSATLAGLTDVALGTLADGNLIAYDIATGKWKNIAQSSRLPNPEALTFGSFSYDGSVAREITAASISAHPLGGGAAVPLVASTLSAAGALTVGNGHSGGASTEDSLRRIYFGSLSYYIELKNIGTPSSPQFALHTNAPFCSDYGVTAGGQGQGGSGGGGGGIPHVLLSESQWEALSTPDPGTIYLVYADD